MGRGRPVDAAISNFGARRSRPGGARYPSSPPHGVAATDDDDLLALCGDRRLPSLIRTSSPSCTRLAHGNRLMDAPARGRESALAKRLRHRPIRLHRNQRAAFGANGDPDVDARPEQFPSERIWSKRRSDAAFPSLNSGMP